MTHKVWVAAFWVAIVACTYFALTPVPPETVAELSDGFLHAFAFTVLTFLCSVAHYRKRFLYPTWWMLAYGVAIELVQGQIEARSAELGDLAVDVLGIGIGLLLVHLFGDTAERIAERILKAVGLERGHD